MIKYIIKNLQKNNIGYKSYDHKAQWQFILTLSPNFWQLLKKQKMLDIKVLATKKHSNVIPSKHNSLLMVKKSLFFSGTTRV